MDELAQIVRDWSQLRRLCLKQHGFEICHMPGYPPGQTNFEVYQRLTTGLANIPDCLAPRTVAWLFKSSSHEQNKWIKVINELLRAKHGQLSSGQAEILQQFLRFKGISPTQLHTAWQVTS